MSFGLAKKYSILYNSSMGKKKIQNGGLSFRPMTNRDLQFLYELYASTRAEEMKATDWEAQQIAEFLGMQFNLQHTQYLQNYPDASYEIILRETQPIGRLYVDRRPKEIRILDIAFLPDFCGKGFGSGIIKELIAESAKKKLPLNLHVERNNPAFRFYKRLGFKKVAENDFYILMEIVPKKKTK